MTQILNTHKAPYHYGGKKAHLKFSQQCLNHFKYRSSFQSLIIVVMTFCMCINIVVANSIDTFLQFVPSITWITGGLTLFYALVMGALIKESGYPLKDFGLATDNLKESMIVAFWMSLAFILLLLALKMYLAGLSIDSLSTVFHKVYADHETAYMSAGARTAPPFNVYTFFLYFLVLAPAQELVVRSGMQSLFYLYIESKYKTFYSIVLANLIFALVHLVYGSVEFVIVTFICGTLLSIMFLYYRSFYAVALSHSLIGSAVLVLFC